MKDLPRVIVSLVIVGGIITCHAEVGRGNWLQFRGPGGASTATSQLPTSWSVDEGHNVAWEVELPGRGVSSPIVVDDQVIVTASSGPRRDRLHVLAFDANTGALNWHRQFWATGRTLCHPSSAIAAPTPASDGERIFAFFSSNDLACLDLEGNLQWLRGLALDHPAAGNDVGMSSSPAVVGDVVVVQSESQGDSFVEALAVTDGETRWQLDRPRRSNWTSPVGVLGDGQSRPAAVLLQSGSGIKIHRADTGELIADKKLACETIASAVSDEYLIVPSNGLALLTWGDADQLSTVWTENRLRAGPASPVVHRGRVYVLSGAVLSCGDPAARQVLWKKRLGGRFWATPVAVGEHLYCFNSDGKTYVVSLADKGKVIAEIEFGDEIWGSPAVAKNALYVRSHQHLWKIAAEDGG